MPWCIISGFKVTLPKTLSGNAIHILSLFPLCFFRVFSHSKTLGVKHSVAGCDENIAIKICCEERELVL
jgi:hypothetical protein